MEVPLQLVDLPHIGVLLLLWFDAELELEPPEAAIAPTSTPIPTAMATATAMTTSRMLVSLSLMRARPIAST